MGRLTETMAYLTAEPNKFSKLTKQVNGGFFYLSYITPNDDLKKVRSKMKLYKKD